MESPVPDRPMEEVYAEAFGTSVATEQGRGARVGPADFNARMAAVEAWAQERHNQELVGAPAIVAWRWFLEMACVANNQPVELPPPVAAALQHRGASARLPLAGANGWPFDRNPELAQRVTDVAMSMAGMAEGQWKELPQEAGGSGEPSRGRRR